MKLELRNTLSGIADVLSNAEIKALGITEDKSLGKLNKKSVYETVNDYLINEIEKGIIPWRKEWQATTGGLQFMNYRSKRPYTGVNPWLIGSKLQDHHCPFFLTLAQIEQRGGKLKSGATKFNVVYFGKAISTKTLEPTPEQPQGETISRLIRFLKEYRVYNLADTTLEIDWKSKIPELTEAQKIDNCEKVYQMMPNKPSLKHGGDRAFYNRAIDYVQMPNLKDFRKEPFYYSTLFHELIHSTGHKKRVDREREFGRTFGDKKYAFEELIAEIGASYLCAHTGILFHTRKNTVAYLQSWMKALAKEAKENKSFFFQAASQSQKAANYILSKQLKNSRKKKEKKASKALSGIKVKRTVIKKLKAKLAKVSDLGKLIKVRRKFEPYTLTDHVAEFLLGRRIKVDSFKRFGDGKHLTGKSGNNYRLHWFGNKGLTKERPLDQLAQDFMAEYFQYSNLEESDVITEMVEIITNYPNGAGAYMDDVNRERQYEQERIDQRDKEEFEKSKVTKKSKSKMTTTKSSPTKQRKIVTSRRIFSTELTIIKNFLNLDGRIVSQDQLASFYARIKKAKANKQIDTHRLLISEILNKVHKALGFALESTENKITVNLETEFKTKCKDSIKNAQVKVRTEYLAGNKPSKKAKTKGLTGVPENIRTQLGKIALMLLGAYDMYAVNNGISFKIKGSPAYNHIEIVLNPKDLYDMTFTKFNDKGIIKTNEVKDVYVEDLHDTIELHTKLFTYFKGSKSLKGGGAYWMIIHPDKTKLPPLDDARILQLANAIDKDTKITKVDKAVTFLRSKKYKVAKGQLAGN